MGTGTGVHGEPDPVRLEPPRWTHGLAALAGVALLIGPALAALWPG